MTGSLLKSRSDKSKRKIKRAYRKVQKWRSKCSNTWIWSNESIVKASQLRMVFIRICFQMLLEDWIWSKLHPVPINNERIIQKSTNSSQLQINWRCVWFHTWYESLIFFVSFQHRLTSVTYVYGVPDLKTFKETYIFLFHESQINDVLFIAATNTNIEYFTSICDHSLKTTQHNANTETFTRVRITYRSKNVLHQIILRHNFHVYFNNNKNWTQITIASYIKRCDVI